MTTWEQLLKKERAYHEKQEKLEDQRRAIKRLIESYEDYDSLNRRCTNNLWENFHALEKFYIFEEHSQHSQDLTAQAIDGLILKEAKLGKEERAVEDKLEEIYQAKRNFGEEER